MGQAWHDVFSSGLFMPHGHCYLWNPAMVWTQVVSNVAIGLAYVVISALLVKLVYEVRELPFKWIYVSFGVFIVSCGMTHFVDVLVIWRPLYWLDAAVRVLTAIASVGTACMLPRLLPQVQLLAQAACAARERGIQLQTAVHDLEHMYRRTRSLEMLKSQFFANVSHELRTPLTLILGPLDRLCADAGLQPIQRRDLDLVRRNAEILLTHVNTLLDLAKLEEGKLTLQYQRCDVAALARRCAAAFVGVAADRHLTLDVAAPAQVDADVDYDKLQRILLNLLGNACKYTPPDGTIACHVSAPAGGDEIVIAVDDSGPGIPEDLRGRLFERFAQGEGPGVAGGSGLGLAIVFELVKLHRGSIDVGRGFLGGAGFTVRLPRSAPADVQVQPAGAGELPPVAQLTLAPAAPAAAEALPPAPPPELGPDGLSVRPLVVVAEDHADMRRYICEFLAQDYVVYPTADGSEALAQVRAVRPDLVITDWMMARTSGSELLQALRADPEIAEIPVMLLTARANEADRVAMLERGARDFLSKPFSLAELRARAANIVEMSRARAILQRAVRGERQTVDGLAKTLRDRTEALDAALHLAREAQQVAEQLSASKSDFLNLVSHELRTPLTALRLQAERVRRRLDGDPAHALLEDMLASAARLQVLVDSLLDFSRGQAQQPAAQLLACDIPALLDALVTAHAAQAQAADIALSVAAPRPLELMTDATLLRLALGHLIDNALKFAGPGRHVVLRAAQLAEHVEIAVEDDGPGIAAADQARIFTPFVHLEPLTNKHTTGVGLGLALVVQLLGALGGSIRVRSQPGAGAAFVAKLPRPRLGGAP